MEIESSKSDSVATSPPKQLWGAWATIGFGLSVGGAFLLTQVLVVAVFAIVSLLSAPARSSSGFFDRVNSKEGLVTALATIASASVCIPLIVLIVKARRGKPFAEYLGLKRVSVKVLLASLAIIAGLVVISDSITLLLGKPLTPVSMVRVYQTSVWPVLLWIALVIFAPAFEELLFRGFLFEGLRQSRLGVMGTIAFTALVWALLHAQYDLYGIASIFVMGIAMGAWRYRTGSLWSTLTMHAAANVIATLEVALNVDRLFH